jgi:hypothetical protein
MIHNDKQLGKPFVEYTATQAEIEALTGIEAGSTAFATDLEQPGWYSGTAWVWGSSGGKYRQFVYTVSGGDFSFVIDHEGNPVMALVPLES